MADLKCSGVRWREVRTPHEVLAAAIVLQALREWDRLHRGRPDPQGSNRQELADFFASDLCQDLCEWGGLDYRRLLALTVGPG